MIVCGSSVAYLLGTLITWRNLALTGNSWIIPYKYCLQEIIEQSESES